MSVQNQIERIIFGLAASYEAIREMGGTIPEVQNIDNLANAIRSIPKDKAFYFPVYTEVSTTNGG